jgi:Flp pilus assembly CpaF family ATPase
MFYSVCEYEEWSTDHYDYARDQHYTEDGEFLSPCIGVELMSRVGKMLFTDVSVVYDDRSVIKFIDKAVEQLNIDRPTNDEIKKFCALVASTYHERNIDEFNDAMFEYIYDCTYSEWTDMYSGQDLYDDGSLLQPDGWGED